MAHEKFPVEVLTPEGSVFKDEVEMVATRTVVGQIGVLARHTPLLATLDPTELRLHRSEGDIVRFAQAEGYIQVFQNQALVLVEEAIKPEDLDAGDLKEKLHTAEEDLKSCEEGSGAHKVAEASQKRLKAWLEILESS